MSTLFDNINTEGNQASRVLDLASASAADLAQTAEQELGLSAASSMNKFRGAVEQLKAALAPVGQIFLDLAIPFVQLGKDILDGFNNLPSEMKRIIQAVAVILGAIAPVAIMTFGLVANGLANLIKTFNFFRNVITGVGTQSNVLGEQMDYMTQEQLEQAASASSLNESHQNLRQTFTVETEAIKKLVAAYREAISAQNAFKGTGMATTIQGASFRRGGAAGGIKVPGFADGIVSVPGPKGAGDVVPAMLSPGEAVIPKKLNEKYAGLIAGIMSDSIPGFMAGVSKVPGRRSNSGIQSEVSGSFQMGHFGKLPQMSGQDLVKWAQTQTSQVQTMVANVVKSVSNGVNAMFNVFDNRVVSISAELNKLMIGGQKAPKSMVERDLVTRGSFAHGQLAKEMHKAKVTVDDTKKAIAEITKEIDQGLKGLGDQSELTGEEIENLIDQAYQKVAKTNKQVRAAYKKMNSGITTIESSAMSGQQRRGVPGAASYRGTANRNQIFNAMERVGEGPSPYPRAGGIKFDENRTQAVNAALPGLNLAGKRLNQLFKQLPQSAQWSVSAVKESTEFNKKFIQELQAAIKNGSIEMSKDLEFLMANMETEVKESAPVIKEALNQALSGVSQQSLQLVQQGRNKKAPVPGLVASQATIRDPKGGTMMTLERYQKQLTARTIAAERLERRRADSIQQSMARFGSLNRGLMGASFGLSSVAGILTFAGGEVGAFGSTMMQLTSAMFGLVTITELLTRAKAIERTMTLLSTAGMTNFAKLSMGAKGFKGLINVVKNVAGAFAKAAPIISRLIPGLGILVTGFFAIKGLVDASNEREAKIESMGTAAALTSEQIKKLGESAQFSAKANPFAGGIAGTGAADAEAVKSLKENEDFLTTYKDIIQDIKTSTDDQIKVSIMSLKNQLRAAGAPENVINEYVEAILDEAGKTDVNLEFGNVDIDEATSTQGIVDVARAAAQLFTDTLKSETESRALSLDISWDGFVIDWVETDAEASARRLGGTLASSATLIASQFKSGELGIDELIAGFNDLQSVAESLDLDPEMGAIALEELISTLPEETAEAISGLTDLSDILLVLSSITSGTDLGDQGLLEQLIAGSGPDATEDEIALAEKARIKITELIGTQYAAAQATESADDAQKAYDATLAAANESMAEQKTRLSDQLEAYKILREAGFGAAEAIAASGDATYAAALVAAGTGPERAQLIADYREIMALEGQLDKVKEAASSTRSGGVARKSPFQEAIDSLKQQQAEAGNALSAYSKLRKAGISVEDAFSAASDSVLAAGIASTKVGTSSWRKLLKTIKDVDETIRKSAILEILKEQRISLEMQTNFAEIIPQLDAIGLSMDEIQDIMGDPNLASAFIEDLRDGKLEAKELNDYIQQMKALKQIEVNIRLATDEGIEEQFDMLHDQAKEMFSIQRDLVEDSYAGSIRSAESAVDSVNASIENLNDNISDKQREIERTFDNPIEAIEEQIASIERNIELSFVRPMAELTESINDMQRNVELDFERPIAELGREAENLSNDLNLLDKAAEEINEKYDSQQEALAKISEINQEIIGQQKSQISLADALSQGDIAQAAQLAQEMRAQSAQAYVDSTSEALEAARNVQLGGLRSARGMSREEIADRQFDIEQEIFKLEQRKQDTLEDIQVLEDEIYEIQEKQEEKQSEILELKDEVYRIEQLRKPALEEIERLEDQIDDIQRNQLRTAEDALEQTRQQRTAELEAIDANEAAWNQAKLAADQAKLSSDAFKNVIEMTNFLLDGTKKTWDDIKDKTITLYKKEVIIPAGETTPDPGFSPGPSDNNGGGGSTYDPTADKRAADTAKEDIREILGTYNDRDRDPRYLQPIKDRVRDYNSAVDRMHENGLKSYKKAYVSYNPYAGGFFDMSRPGVSISYKNKGGMVAQYAMGGNVMKYAMGGMFKSLGSDTVPAMLTPGEFVIKRAAVNEIGVDKLEKLNSTGEMNDGSVYNYSVNVNVRSDANPDEIARTVMSQIKRVDSQRMQGNRF